MDWTKTAVRRDERYFSFGISCVLCYRFDSMSIYKFNQRWNETNRFDMCSLFSCSSSVTPKLDREATDGVDVNDVRLHSEGQTHSVLFFLCAVTNCNIRTDSSFVPSQWEMASLCSDVSHWLCPSLKSALNMINDWIQGRRIQFCSSYVLYQRQHQGWFQFCTQPMRDGVTL